MIQEEKSLLLKDLCARLPYGIKLKHIPSGEDTVLEMIGCGVIDGDIHDVIENFKPYLRSMSTMTKEELEEANRIINEQDYDGYFFIQEPPYYYGIQLQTSDIGSVTALGLSKVFDYLNSIHIDYRRLIDAKLAIEAPINMYNLKGE